MNQEKSFTELLTGCLGVWVIVLVAPLLLALPNGIYAFFTWRWFAVPYLGLPPLPSIWTAIGLNILFAFTVRTWNTRALREEHYKLSMWTDAGYSEFAKLLAFGTAAALHFSGLA